ncbi:HNH endonuclease signature motif containing protein [Alishewanella sp. SMS8]|uniref:HNH endonuclease signature motif containing protein n=1 Tax=Alishewanella sp. SMS8 TaxID=2994676 RepID=UPI0027410140|nr:HNH endonuclease signature motif containing protein [Alishewanella sp. SMS8]MDP5205852.1 HNH endonuclease signature motif containing protein [Alishewanella sp. SMS9]MDP5459851.1 HNH endonuclease signature motif containing protein [Alishewanella sp. SMS8]
MSRFIYTTAMLDFLRVNYPKMGKPDLTKAFNAQFGTCKTVSNIKTVLSNHKIRCGRKTGSLLRGRLRVVTKEQAAFIAAGYKKWTIERLTAEFNKQFNANKSTKQIRCFTRNHELKSGRNGQFEKGHITHNKGVKGWKPGGNAQKSQFKKGQLPACHKPIGSERICSKGGFVMVKVAEPRTWRMQHVLEWEKHNPPVQKNECVTFKDNNPLNWHIDNLMLVTRAQLAVMNKFGLGKAPAELKEAARTLADITMKRCQILREQAA